MSRPPKPIGRPTLPVDQETPGGRLRALRKGARLSQEDAGDKLHTDRSMISRYENGDHTMPDHFIERASQVFGVTPAFIRYGDVSQQMTRVVGAVGAGARVEANDDGERYVEIPASWDDATALVVRGLSCYPIYEEGDVLVIRGAQRLTPDEVLGRMCVVETADGLGYVKKVRKGTQPGLYNLESPNAPLIEDVMLTSARPVRLHLSR